MHTLFVDPQSLSPDDLDRWLARGWYRMGQSLFTARYVVFDDVLRTAIWTRLDLRDYRFRKSLRRVLHRVDANFRTTIHRCVVDAEHEALYQRYRAIAKGERSPTLHDFLHGDSDSDLFDTWEVSIRDGDRLVGFSWFDLGREGIQSLIGVYEPDLAQFSLGFYTMLAEIRHGLETGRRWFYPGYVLPGDPSMDYKLRVGEMEFLDAEANRWRPWSEFPSYDLPTARLHSGLEAARVALAQRGIPARQRLIAWFDVAARQPALASCLSEPLVVECWPDTPSATRLMACYDVDRRHWTLVRCLRAEARRVDGQGRVLDPDTGLELWVVVERYGHRADPSELAEEVLRLGA